MSNLPADTGPQAQPTGAAARLGQRLAERGGVRVRLTEILALWSGAEPSLVGRSDQLPELAVALDALATAGIVELPSQRSWDRTTRPPLPRFVNVPTARRPVPARGWQSYAWGEQLGWVASLRYLSDELFRRLTAVNSWLADPTADRRVVPMRVRSAELFGGEKAIDGMLQTTIFGSNRLTLELLGCRRLPPPLVIRDVGAGGGVNPDVLVVENADSYWLAVGVLDLLGEGVPVGRVAWGAGGAAAQSVPALREERVPVGEILYWGDLDPAGVTIASELAAEARRWGLRVVPAGQLWAALCSLEPSEPGSFDWGEVDGTWLGELWPACAAVRSAGGRVAQERLGLADLERLLRKMM